MSKERKSNTKNESDGEEHYVLRLYVAGVTHRSIQAIANVKNVCETHLEGRFELQVIDIYQHPALAKGDQIIAVPTLIKKLPVPLRTLIGDLSNTERVLIGLDLKPLSPKDGKGASD